MNAYLHYYFYYNLRNATLGARGITEADQWRLFHDQSYEGYSSANEYVFGSPYAKAWLRERTRHATPQLNFWLSMAEYEKSVPAGASLDRIRFILDELESTKTRSN